MKRILLPSAPVSTTLGKAWGRLSRAAGLGLALALLLSSCTFSISPGGDTRPGGYTCNAGASQYGCFTMLGLSPTHINADGKPDMGDFPVVAESDLTVVPLSCDAACQNSSGGGNPPGYISNFLEMWEPSNNAFIQVGYLTTPNGTLYFVRYYLPDLTTPYRLVYLGPTQIESDFSGTYPYSTFAVGGDPTSGKWIVAIKPGYPAGAATINYAIGMSPTFHPLWLFYGQVVYGASGATAKGALFTNNYLLAGNNGGFGFPTFYPLAEDGVPPSPVATVDHPTDAGWFFHPASTDYGGTFYVSCCQPLP